VNVLTTTASSHDPAAFIRAVGAAYRASGRQLPLFDGAGHNPYSLFPGEPPTARHDVYVGQGDYDRLVAALDESFAGTAQPPVPIWYLENGFQTTTVGVLRRSHYSGRETVAGRSSRTQAAQIAAALRSPPASLASPRTSTSCSSTRLLGGWQSGRCGPTGDASPRSRLQAAIAEVRNNAVDCTAALRG
jgi:hypothetical protein